MSECVSIGSRLNRDSEQFDQRERAVAATHISELVPHTATVWMLCL